MCLVLKKRKFREKQSRLSGCWNRQPQPSRHNPLGGDGCFRNDWWSQGLQAGAHKPCGAFTRGSHIHRLGSAPLCTPSVRGRVTLLAMAIFIYFRADIRIVFIMPYVKQTFFRSVHYLERISGEPPLGRISLGPTWVPDVFLLSFLMVSSLSGFYGLCEFQCLRT